MPGDDLPAYAAARLKALRIGDEGMLDPRAAAPGRRSRARRAGLAVWRYDRAARVDTVLDEQIVEVSDEWLAEREIGELHFTFGSLDLEELGPCPFSSAGSPGRARSVLHVAALRERDGYDPRISCAAAVTRRRDAREALLARALEAAGRLRGARGQPRPRAR